MRVLTGIFCGLALALGACSKPAAPEATPLAAEPAATPEPAAPAEAKAGAFVTVIYNPPTDPAAFEQYYWETHVPLVAEKQDEIGFTASELTHFTSTLDGQPSPYCRQAVLWFADMEALEKGLASEGFKAVGDDLANFASGGLMAMVGEETGEASPLMSGDQTSFVTVIYQPPTDAAAFETYYADIHLPIVDEAAGEIQFQRRELTRFSRNLDGTPATLYRQAKLYFPDEAALKAGSATPGFGRVGGDLPNFATGGVVALIGHLTSAPSAP